MPANRPSAVVKQEMDRCITIVSATGIETLPEGETVLMDKEHLRLCTDPVVAVDTGSDGVKWSGSLPAGEALIVNEFPDGATGVSVKTCECFKMMVGTEDMPIPEKPPEENPVKENAPCLYEAGEHAVPTTVDGCPVNGLMLINCNDAALAYELKFTGC